MSSLMLASRAATSEKPFLAKDDASVGKGGWAGAGAADLAGEGADWIGAGLTTSFKSLISSSNITMLSRMLCRKESDLAIASSVSCRVGRAGAETSGAGLGGAGLSFLQAAANRSAWNISAIVFFIFQNVRRKSVPAVYAGSPFRRCRPEVRSGSVRRKSVPAM